MQPLKHYKEHSTDPYEGKKHYKELNSQVTEYKGKTYLFIDYKKSHGMGWRIKQGSIALSLTILTGFLGLASKRVRARWIQAHSGESIKKVKIPTAEVISSVVPEKADFAYRGSNAEYLVLNKEGNACTFEEYQTIALGITSLRFPRPEKDVIEAEALEKLHANEAEEIESRLKDAGLTPVKIPKSLYDLFYWRFYLEDMTHAKTKPEDTAKIFKVAKERFERGEKDSPDPSWRKIDRVYAYKDKGEGDIAIHVPKIDFDLSGKEGPYGPVIANRYRKQEADENYQKVTYELNERIFSYLKTQDIDPTDLSWENMRKVTLSLINDIDATMKLDVWNKEQCLGRPVEFGRKYLGNKERIHQFILGAIWHEYKAPPNVYTVYRGAELHKDLKESDNPYSFSFGHSPFGGLQFDGSSGSPMSYSDKTLYALDIDIEDYEKGGEAAQVIFIPEARGPNRITEHAEVGHVRSKWKYQKDSDQTILGFSGGGFLGANRKDLEFLIIPADTPEEVKEHIKVTRVFFKNVHTVIVK